jgi:hypothetical protein
MLIGEIVEIGDDGLMMPVMMEFHGLGIDMRLERVERVGEGTELERTGGHGSCGLRKNAARRSCNGSNAGCCDHELAPGHGNHRGFSVEGKVEG